MRIVGMVVLLVDLIMVRGIVWESRKKEKEPAL